MRNYVPPLVFFSVLLAFIIWMIDFGMRPDIYIDKIRTGYSGIITDKSLKRTTILTIKTDEGKVIEVGILCDALVDSAKVGDRIEKIPNENYVMLRKNNRVLKLPYIYINRKLRNDRRWPKEWKEKWPESTK